MSEKIEHKQVRFLMPDFPKDKINEEVEREDRLVRWADSFYLNAVRMTAAACLTEWCGTLDKAASLLETAGFKAPAGILPEDEALDLDGEEALQRYVELDEEGIRKAHASIGFYLVGTGQSMNPAEDYLHRQ